MAHREGIVVDEQVIGQWVERLRTQVPGTVAVVLKGSYARGNPGPWSDLDFDVLTFDEDVEHEYLTWIEDDGTGRLLHVSVAVERLDDWVRGFRETAPWSFGLPSHEETRLLWLGRPSLRAELDRPRREHPGGEPELEDFVEGLGKARNAYRRGDEVTVRLAVQGVATLCPSLLVPLNPPVSPGTRPEALKAALSFPVAPPEYRDDMHRCLGLDGRASTPEEVLAAAERLVLGTLALLETNADTISPLVPPHLPEVLRGGLLRRYLEQDTPSGRSHP
jgi:hypothetical protein